MPVFRRVATATVVLALVLVVAPAATPTADSAPLSRIAVTTTGMVDSATGAAFTPRGVNYIRLADPGTFPWYISTFEPGVYDRPRALDLMRRLRDDGYNTIRTFIDEGRPLGTTEGIVHGIGRGMEDERPFDPAYMDNVADFVLLAIEHGIRVIPVTYRLPQNCYYYRIVWNGQKCDHRPAAANVEGRNAFFLDGGFMNAKAEYMKQFSAGLLARIGAENSTAILVYQSENEAYFDTKMAPFSRSEGTFKGGDGVTYDMSVARSRQQAADANFVRYTHRAKQGLLQGDPDGKLMVGFYSNYAVGNAGFDGFATHCSTACDPAKTYRYPARPLVATLYGAVDLTDLHFYPRDTPGYTVAAELNTVEVGQLRKFWINGEIGAFRERWSQDVTAAANGVRDAQVAACSIGSGAKGSLFWTFDNNDNNDQRRLFTLIGDDGAINNLHAPRFRPDMCVR